MTKAKTTEEVEAEEETTDEADANVQHAKPLFTGDLGGHVLLDSTTDAE